MTKTVGANYRNSVDDLDKCVAALMKTFTVRRFGSYTRDDLKIAHVERELICEALHRTAGDVRAAARLVGLGNTTMYRKIRKLAKEQVSR